MFQSVRTFKGGKGVHSFLGTGGRKEDVGRYLRSETDKLLRSGWPITTHNREPPSRSRSRLV